MVIMTSRSRVLLLAKDDALTHRKLETEDLVTLCEVAHRPLEDKLQEAIEIEINRIIDRQALSANTTADTVGAGVEAEAEVVGGAKAEEGSGLLTMGALRAGR